MDYPVALEIVRQRVKPLRDENARKVRREKWWLLGELVPALRKALFPLDRYVAGTRVGKRILFCWCDPWTAPSDAINVFTFDDDFSFGVLCSKPHGDWASRQSSTLRVDIRYTSTSAFETFPWPDPITDAQREQIAELARKIVARRQEICLERQIGLTHLYNELDEGAYADLAALHRKLDEAVCAAYGWPRSIAGDPDETNARLLALNQEIAAGERPYDPFSYLSERATSP